MATHVPWNWLMFANTPSTSALMWVREADCCATRCGSRRFFFRTWDISSPRSWVVCRVNRCKFEDFVICRNLAYDPTCQSWTRGYLQRYQRKQRRMMLSELLWCKMARCCCHHTPQIHRHNLRFFSLSGGLQTGNQSSITEGSPAPWKSLAATRW